MRKLVTLAALMFTAPVAHADATHLSPPTRVVLQTDGPTIVGFLYKPEGTGPWPALVWNHGSEKDPGAGPQFPTVASFFVPAGYVVFAPERRGHGESEGDYIVTRMKFTARNQGRDAADRLTVHLLGTEQLHDQLAGLAYVQQLPYVDRRRIFVAGCSFGGIEALLGAESRAGYRAAVAISPGGLMWDRSEQLRARMLDAVRRMEIPVLLIQPAHDASLGPTRVLGVEAARLGKPITTRVYPESGPDEEQGHCFGGAKGLHVWAEDAKAFFEANMPR